MKSVAAGKSAPVVVWFRDDLRLADNPALAAAVASGLPLACVYVHDEESDGLRKPGGAARWFLHGALAALKAEIADAGGELILLAGKAKPKLLEFAAALKPTKVLWNRRYDAPGRQIDAAIEAALKQEGIEVETHSANLLFEPSAVATKSGTPFHVFKPFWRSALGQAPLAPALPAPPRIAFCHLPEALRRVAISLDALALEPHAPDWASGLRATWERSEKAAHAALADFLADGLGAYAQDRDRPDLVSTSRLSPYLRFGLISPRQIWHAVSKAKAGKENRDKFLYELGWREFSYHLLYHRPDIAERDLRAGVTIAWRNDRAALCAWQRGITGYPIVDAAMRELWQTGWMHNRLRMIVASFLIKHLLISWREGEAWFWDTLVDADPASNPANWQWVAGTGTDSSPFFRIFNPVLQAKKFDPDGAYVRRYVPELAGLSAPLIHEPWKAMPMDLGAAGVKLGETYPAPIVEHEFARERALKAWKRGR